jgi:putative ABC transport system permease protein
LYVFIFAKILKTVFFNQKQPVLRLAKVLQSGTQINVRMYKNYLLVALRNIWRNRSYSFINISGLAMSLAVCLVVISILVHNFSYDTFHAHKNRITRLVQSHEIFDMQIPFATVPFPAGEFIKEQSADIEDVATLARFGGNIQVGQNVFTTSGLYADDSFFNVFSFTKENAQGSLNEPYTIFLTKSAAKKYFGTQDPLGKIVSITDLGDFTVTGVTPDVPPASHIQFEVLVSLATFESAHPEVANSWMELGENAAVYHYFLLKDGKTQQHLQPIVQAMMKEKYPVNESKVEYRFQDFTTIAPSTEWMNNEVSMVPARASAYLLFGLALLIMASAGFNYTNLSIARSLTRAREVGLRKISGANRLQVYGQFIAESTVLALLALVMALALVPILQDAFASLMGKSQGISFATDYRVYLFFLLFTLVTGWAVGAMPAALLSKFRPSEVLKDSSGLRLMKGVGFRKALIIFQFAMAIVFLISANIVSKQFQFALNGPMGFRHSHVLSILTQGEDYQKIQAMVEQNKDALEVSASSFLPGTNRGASDDMVNPESDKKGNVFFLSGDRHFISSIDLKLVAGTNFPENLSATTERFMLVNETFVRELGYGSPAEAVGKTVRTSDTELEIIGVLKDFHYRPLDAPVPIGPAAVRYRPSEFAMVNVVFQAGQEKQLIASLEKSWRALDTGRPFEYDFFDEQIQRSLNGYRIMNGLMTFVSFLTAMIACLGLLGMALYANQTKLKEIAVRKVIGATEWQVVTLLSKGFVINLLVACALALPISFLLNKMWLDRLPYHIEITADLLITGVLMILTVGLLTIVSQTWRAANANPVKFLKRE